jgi:hypothetical protein
MPVAFGRPPISDIADDDAFVGANGFDRTPGHGRWRAESPGPLENLPGNTKLPTATSLSLPSLKT